MLPEGAYETVLESLYDGLYITDRDRRIRYWNRAAEQITGYAAGEVIGSRCSDNILLHVDAAGNSLCTGTCPLAAALDSGVASEMELYLRHKFGHKVPVLVRVAPLRNARNEIVGGVELFADNSPREALRLQLESLSRMALVDPLTQIPNRRHFETQVHALFAHMQRDAMPFGMLFIDVDRFKKFNDTCGHEVGDLALRAVARTLSLAVRPFDTVARWGGEEFAALFPNAGVESLRHTGSRLCALVRHSRVEAAGAMALTVSIGGAVARPGDSLESLVRRADSMMYRSKEEGRDRVTVAEG
jgi:diguanylate cyclase (GGDEF)-like protein/PAS domain S-box-containing protein